MSWLPRPRGWVWATEVNRFTVVYDACVLYPAPLRDLLMRLALTELVCMAMRQHQTSLKNPPKTVEEYLVTLEEKGLQTATWLLGRSVVKAIARLISTARERHRWPNA